MVKLKAIMDLKNDRPVHLICVTIRNSSYIFDLDKQVKEKNKVEEVTFME